MTTALELAALERLCAAHQATVIRSEAPSGVPVIRVPADAAPSLLAALHEEADLSLHRLVDLTAVDYQGALRKESERFEVRYLLASTETGLRLRVVVALGSEAPELASVVRHWPAAGWLEREVFDLFGIRFEGHPDLRRILLDAEFEGAPLRKDQERKDQERKDQESRDHALRGCEPGYGVNET